MNRLFHYTAAPQVESILRDRFIKLATDLVPQEERAAAWLSLAQHWEGTASKMVISSDGTIIRTTRVSEMAKYMVPTRIEVDPTQLSLVTWREHKRTSGINAREARCLERSAKKTFASDPYLYRCCYEPIPSSAFIRIEYWEDWKWYPWPPAEAVVAPVLLGVAA
jgi:hypothetical protein